MPLHSREARDEVLTKGGMNPKDSRTVLVDGRPALEYDGLHLGELAWILGRRFKAVAPGAGGAGGEPYKRKADGTIELDPTTGRPVPNPARNGLNEMSTSTRYAHQANLGMGTGVDRMQRLASQPWVESMIMTKLGTTIVDLHAIRPASDYATMMDSSLFELKDLLSGSTALHVNDVTRMAQARAQIAPGKRVNEQKQGILLLETGPFLRGMQFNTDAVQVPEPSINDPHTYSAGVLGRTYAMPRNAGDNCAFAALNTELRRRNIFDWTPDGIVLSKLESPTDEPMKSTELDAREAQLFNVAVQGPAISTTWTSDIRDHKLQCQPMDRVFICLVADLSFGEKDDEVKAELDRRATATAELLALYDSLETNRRQGNDLKTVKSDILSKLNELTAIGATIESKGAGAAPTPAENYQVEFDRVREIYTYMLNAYKNVESLEDGVEAKEDAKADLAQATEGLTALTNRFKADFTFPEGAAREAMLKKIGKTQEEMRRNTFHVGRAVLTNFRYMRTTSAHLANYSYFDPSSPNSRCGLRFGNLKDEGHTAEYIVGAWCIGTVIDSAASRAHVGQMIRTAPTSMALNVNVNIEWWSGDKLYKHYMDTSGLVMRRGQVPPLGEGVEYPKVVDGMSDEQYTAARKKARGEARVMGAVNMDVMTTEAEAKMAADAVEAAEAAAAAAAAAKAAMDKMEAERAEIYAANLPPVGDAEAEAEAAEAEAEAEAEAAADEAPAEDSGAGTGIGGVPAVAEEEASAGRRGLSGLAGLTLPGAGSRRGRK